MSAPVFTPEDYAAVAHTPGPWSAESSIYEHMIAEVRGVRPGDECAIAQVWKRPSGFADARLMAAAPDLLAAAKRALNTLKAQGESVRPGNVLGALDAAIAKAEGRS